MDFGVLDRQLLLIPESGAQTEVPLKGAVEFLDSYAEHPRTVPAFDPSPRGLDNIRIGTHSVVHKEGPLGGSRG
jgi:hypothetical protein